MQSDGRLLKGKMADIDKLAALGRELSAKPSEFTLPEMPKHPRNISDNK
jgi:hypothetical protein